MWTRFDKEVPISQWQDVPPPIGPDGLQYGLERGNRRARAEALRTGLRSSGTALMRALKPVLNFVRCGGYGISKRVPDRLTSPCR